MTQFDWDGCYVEQITPWDLGAPLALLSSALADGTLGVPRVGDLARAAVRPGGLPASGVFPIGRPPAQGGPPFGYQPDAMDAVLDGLQRIRTGDPAHLFDDELPWSHRLAVWRRP